MNSNSVQQILCKQVQQTKKVLTLQCSYYTKASCTSFLVKSLSPGKNLCLLTNWGFPSSSAGKESACQCSRCKRLGSNPVSGRFPGEGNGNLLQYSSLENSMDRIAWLATVQAITKSQTRLSTHASLKTNARTQCMVDNL